MIIPAFNVESYVYATLESVQNQTFSEFEVIVVDDCSFDATPEIIQEFVNQDSRFRYIRLEENSQRPAVPRNVGLNLALGEYVAFLDADDLWTRKKLERQVMVLDSQTDLALIHSHLWDFTNDPRIKGIIHITNPYRRRSNYEILRQRNVVQCSSAIARTSVLRDLGGFDERQELRAIEDYHLWLRIGKHGYGIGYISEIHGFYRKRPFSTSALEDINARLGYLDSIEGTQCMLNRVSLPHRLVRKLGGYPMALYYHLLQGNWRQLMRRKPHVFTI